MAMFEQEHEIWLDRNDHYTLAKFHAEMETKIIWGPSQTLAVWVVELDSPSQWKIRRDEHFHQLILSRWNEKEAVLAVDVVNKDDESVNTCSGVRFVSGVTSAGSGVPCNAGSSHASVNGQGSSGGTGNGQGSAAHGNGQGSAAPDITQGSVVPDNVEGTGDTCSSLPPSMPPEQAQPVDWAQLIVEEEANEDGDAKAAVDEDKVYEAMGFAAADERADEAAREAIPIPAMTAEMQADMDEAAVPVDDHDDQEPMFDWDRENPDLFVGVFFSIHG